MKLWRKSALIAPAVIVAMTAAACGGGSDSGDSGSGGGGTQTGGQAVFGESTAFPDNLFPSISAGNSTATANAEVRVLLAPFQLFPDFTYKTDPDLMAGDPATETTGGKQVTTYKINPKAVWSDGTPISAKDFEFTWRLQKSVDPKDGGCADLLSSSGYEQIASVEGADNDKTVTVTYTKPYGDWRALFTLFPQHIMDKTDAKANCAVLTKGWPIAGGIPVSSGPWLLDKTGVDISKKILTLTRNPKWWGTPSKLDRIIIQNIGSDPTVSVNALRNKEVQVIYPQPQLDLVKQIKGLEPQITSGTNFGLTFEHLDFNTKDAQLGQLPIRQAIAYAMNRAEIVSKTVGQFDNRAQVLNNRYLVNNQPGYTDTSGGLYNKPDTSKSDQLLTGLGYAKGADGIYAKGGQRLSFEIMTTQSNPLREATIDVITSQLKTAGIEIKKFLNPDIFAGPEKPRSLSGGQFQIALFAWVSSPTLSQNASIYASPKSDNNFGQNYSRGSDPAVDALLPKVAEETDATKQAELGNQVDTQLWKDLFTLPLYQKPTFLAYDSSFTGIEENSTLAGPLWNSDKWARKA